MSAIQFFGGKPFEESFNWGNAVYVDGLDDSIHIPYSPSLDFTETGYTIAGWCNIPAELTGVGSILTNWDGISNAARRLSFNTALAAHPVIGLRHLSGNTVSGGYNVSGIFSEGMRLNNWDFRVWQLDRFGVRGPVGNSWSINPLLNIGGGDSAMLNHGGGGNVETYSFANKIWSFNIQVGNSAGGLRYAKYMDTFAFFNRVLINEEILQLYAGGNGSDPTKIPNCVACYNFNEPSNTAVISSAETPGSSSSRIILDSSGNGNHAYATGYASGSTDFVDHFNLI